MPNPNDPNTPYTQNTTNITVHGGQVNTGTMHGNMISNQGQMPPAQPPPQPAAPEPARPEPFKANMPELQGKGGLFISYASDDRPWIEGVVREFSQRSIVVWWDQMNLPLGSNWRDMIQAGVYESKACLLFVSARSMASNEVKIEYRAFISQNKPIYPVMLEQVPLPIELAGLQTKPYKELPYIIDFISKFVR